MPNAFENMDRMYRFQRHFYDITRKYYLLGRDRLLDEMKVQPGERVLEIGCGTARNLIILAGRHPETHFYGLDASTVMLATAHAKVIEAQARNITLKTALAENFSFDSTFELTSPFDKIFFSYSISMIPTWRQAIERSLENLRQRGDLFFVDFYDQRELPGPFRLMLKKWLLLFDVQPWPDLMPFLRSLEHSEKITLSVIPLFRRYAFIGKVCKTA